MKDVLMLTEDEILSIPLSSPEQLFTGCSSEDELKKAHQHLNKRWHPDRNPDVDPRVMPHVNALHDEAVNKFAMGSWFDRNLAIIRCGAGRSIKLRYKTIHRFELGEMMIGDSQIVFALHHEHEDLYQNATKIIKEFYYADAEMEKEFSRYLPKIKREVKSLDRMIISIEKTPDVFCLKDVLAHYGGKLDEKHVAWIMSSMMNIACFLEFNDLSHNGISSDSVFISPQHHTALLLGGWWYTSKLGKSIDAASYRLIDLAPEVLTDDYKTTSSLNVDLVKGLGRELLGDLIGSKLQLTNLPPPLVNWLKTPSSNKATEEYKKWYKQVLPDSFGPRKFVELNLTAAELYKEK